MRQSFEASCCCCCSQYDHGALSSPLNFDLQGFPPRVHPRVRKGCCADAGKIQYQSMQLVVECKQVTSHTASLLPRIGRDKGFR